MPEHQELKDQARAKTRELLAQSQSFLTMDRSEQMMLYKELVDAHYNGLAEAQGLSTEMTAGDLIDSDRHFNQRVGKKDQTTADILSDTVKKVDFPGFVRDLLNGVFDANLNANIKQMEAFQKLLKEASKSLAQFAKEVDDTEALYSLTKLNNDYKLGMAQGGQGSGRSRRQATPKQGAASPPQEPPQPVLVDNKTGKEVSLNDNAIQAKLLDIKLAMAKERRTMLRETILMGVSRLVVEKGTIRASVKFSINADETTTNTDTGHEDATRVATDYWNVDLGIVSFGRSNTTTKVQVSDARSETTMGADSSTELEGFVEIQFKSDYFKLDNFKESFDLGAGQVASGATPRQQLPPVPAPAPTPSA
ncbi:MAG: hypothetical protein KME13_11860 [Myxacorys californica WJT36-NPBG1]|jgi:hypothetical protein|nr:hypothetical protein [Myxacorys californica WJT36-NPBG1]